MKKYSRLRSTLKTLVVYAALGTMLTAQSHGYAAEAQLADVPLASSSTAVVKPNILFVLDDSGSMDWEFMPDEMSSYSGRTSYRSHICNTIYYNPNITYLPPKNADGTSFPNSVFTAAKNNGYSSSSGTTDLSLYYYFGNDAYYQRAYYYTFTGATPPTPLQSGCQGSAPNAKTSLPIFPDVNGSWTKVQIPAAQETNFANWYSYYSNRMKAMKGAASRAFVTLSASYRVGFLTINPGSTVASDKYLKISDFDAAHKSAWFSKLFGSYTSGATPLRSALSRAGWIYAGKLNTGLTSGIPTADDPIQYSCQQNFTILTTDGYWNGGGGVDLANNSVGNQDGNLSTAPRPMHDGSSSEDRTVTVVTSFQLAKFNCSGSQKRIRRTITTTTSVQPLVGGVASGSPTVTSNASNTYTTSCSGGSPAVPATTTVGPTTTRVDGIGGTSDNLADTSQYYYATDLRTTTLGNCTSGSSGNNVCENNVPASGTAAEDDKASHQHMTTFTLGLGIFGTLAFSSDYKSNTDPTTTFNKIRAGTVNWPDANNGSSEKADDLWHTAVNGRGTAFAAYNPDDLITGLNAALSGVNARVASAAAAATSNLEPVAGDNFAYTASYETQRWVGELQAREIDLATGVVSTTPVWSAQAKLDAKTGLSCDNRVIKMFRSGATNNLVDLKWNTFACDSSMVPTGAAVTTMDTTEQAWFNAAAVATLLTPLSDGTGGTVNQRAAAVGAPLLNFVRGQRGKEDFVYNDLNALYRTRTHVLGDIVNAQPVFVKAPFGAYTDTGYSSFKSTNSGRTSMVYVAANDGMLHAFYAGSSTSDTNGGVEAWAYVPRFVAPNLWKLADSNYANLHQFFVDGTPTVGDVYDATATTWKSILVAGVNKGGKGFYALDITDPANPKALWEFTYSATCYDSANSATWGADCNMGYSYGNPAISKLSDGTWVVFVSSGYNNVNGAANDGQGYLYVLNAITGKIIKKIGTGAGSGTTPSNLGKINNWVDSGLTDNTTVRVYGADLLGNLWRFDVNGAAASGSTATRIATFKDASNNAQPITIKPELTSIGGNPYVLVATGRYLGASDLSDTQTQSIYTIRDPLSTTAYTNPRSSLKKLTMVNGTTVIGGVSTTTRTSSCTTNCSATDGWFVDLPDSGERVNVDMKLQLGTLTVLSNVPQSNACNIGGYSYINFFDYATGLAVPSSTGGSVGQKLSDSLAVGLNIVRLPSGKTVAIATTSDASQRTLDVPVASPGLTGRRVSWRELGE